MTGAIYHVSDRPEAYEVWGEISRAEAKAIALTIARHAAARFPEVEFRVSDTWNLHGGRLNLVAAYIDKHWQGWAAGILKHAQAA